MIIYGSGYFNRRDHSLVRGSCQSCGQRGYLRSYTSTHFITLYFLPVIPIGSKKIIEECPHCKNALGLSRRKFNAFRKKDLPQAVARFEANPSDKDAAEAALAAIVQGQQKTELKRLAPTFRSVFTGDGRLLYLLAHSCSHLCLDDLADEYFLGAVKADPDDEIAAAAEAHIKSKNLPKPKAPNRLLQSLPVFIVPGLIIFALASLLQTSTSTHPRDAYLVNGLDQAYRVLVNGEEVSLPPRQRVSAPMLQFTGNTIRPIPGELAIPSADFDLGDASFAGRAFAKNMTIVNPDRAAIISWEQTAYSAKPLLGDHFSYKFHVGKLVHSFRDIDYQFRPFPDEVSVSGASEKTYKARVDLLASETSREILSLLYGNGQTQQLSDYLDAILPFTGDDASLLSAGSKFLPAERFLQIARPHLDARPIQIEWHRAYQTVAEQNGDDVEAEYRRLHESDPTDGSLAYLYGRAVEDPAQSVKILAAAADAYDQSGYSANALAYHYLLDGDFSTARAYSDKALSSNPASEQFEYMRRISLYGARDFDELYELLSEPSQAADFDPDSLYSALYALAGQGKVQRAREILETKLAALQSDGMTSEQIAEARPFYEIAIPIATQDSLAYREISRKGTTPNWIFQTAVLDGNLGKATIALMASPDDFSIEDRLLLFTLARAEGSGEDAADLLSESIVSELSQGSADAKRWAKWLSGEEAPDLATAAHACENLEQQFLFMAALSQVLPNGSEECLQRARAIVNKENFYSLALAETFAAASVSR